MNSHNKDKLERLNSILDENRGLLRRMLSVQEAEHRHLVALLHDDFGQALVAIKSFATAIGNLTDEDMAEAHELAEMIKELSQDVYLSAYDLMRELRAGLVDNLGFQEGVESCIQSARLKERGAVTRSEFNGDLDSLDEFIKVIALRIVQECLTLIIRNDQPSRVNLALYLKEHTIEERRESVRNSDDRNSDSVTDLTRNILHIEIESDGAGIGHDQLADSALLQSTRDRVAAFGGQVLVERGEQESSHIRVTLDVTDFVFLDEKQDD